MWEGQLSHGSNSHSSDSHGSDSHGSNETGDKTGGGAGQWMRRVGRYSMVARLRSPAVW